MAQSVEHVIGNDEVISSILITSSKKALLRKCFFTYFLWILYNTVQRTETKSSRVREISAVRGEFPQNLGCDKIGKGRLL